LRAQLQHCCCFVGVVDAFKIRRDDVVERFAKVGFKLLARGTVLNFICQDVFQRGARDLEISVLAGALHRLDKGVEK